MVSTIQLFNKMIIQSVAGISYPTWLIGVSDSPGECVFEYGFWCWIALMLKVYQQVLQEVLRKSHSCSVVMPQVLEHQCFTRRIFWILNSETWVGCHLVLSDKHLFSRCHLLIRPYLSPAREFIMNFPYLISAVLCRYCMYCKTSFGKVGIRMHVHRLNLPWMETWTYIKPQGRLLHSQRSSQVELKIFEGGHFIYQHLGFAPDPHPHQSCNSWILMHSVKRSNACDMAWLRWLHARNF